MSPENQQDKDLEDQALRDNRLEIIGHLTAGITHDLNQLLQVFLSGPDILRRLIRENFHQLPEDIGRVLDVLESTGQRGTEMSKQISAFVRGSDGNRTKSIAPEFLLTQMREMLRASFPANIQVSAHAAPGTAKVQCDPVQIGQVLLNLAVNAKDSLGLSGGKITVFAQNSALEIGPCVEISMRDNGRGISRDILPRIFEAFFTTKEPGKGSGLGLSMARKIMHDHGGDITVESDVTGTCFHLYLPVAHAEETRTQKLDRMEPFKGNDKLVLIVDDEEHMRMIIGMFLQDVGYRTLSASSGMEALSYFHSNSDIALLLTDLNMPYFNGLDLAHELRDHHYTTPIVFMTGSTLTEPGAYSVLFKPFTRDKLLNVLHEVLLTTPEESSSSGS